MTEDEAKAKRCCGPAGCGETHDTMQHKQSLYMAAVEIHAASVALLPRFCMGSACMAWRWNDVRDWGQKSVGYCGLRGSVPS